MPVLTTEQKQTFIEQGFLHLPGLIPESRLSSVQTVADTAYETGNVKLPKRLRKKQAPNPEFPASVNTCSEVTSLFHDTPLHEIANDILGEGNAQLLLDRTQVRYNVRNQGFIDAGMTATKPHPRRRWQLDEPAEEYRAYGADYFLLFGVALSEEQEVNENRGQCTVFPGSHYVTHKTFKQAYEQRDGGDALEMFNTDKPGVGKPRRICMKRGDIFVLHQRLAATDGINVSDFVCKNVCMRVGHSQFQDIAKEFVLCDTPWVGFGGLLEHMGSEKKLGSVDMGARAVSGAIHLTDEQKRHFIDQGYVILRQAVPKDILDRAEAFADRSVEVRQGKKVKKDGEREVETREASDMPELAANKYVKKSSEISALMYDTGLLNVAEDLLGEGNVTLRKEEGQIAFNAPIEPEGERSLTMPLKRHKWHIDGAQGKYVAVGSDFLFLVGIILSDGQDVDENRGQFVLFPESHYKTHLHLREIIKNTTKGEDIMFNWRKSKPDIGEPIRTLVKRGDVIIAHQRVGHCPGFNFWTQTRKNIYFRVMHRNLDDLIEEFLESDTPWVGFNGLKDMLPPGAVGEEIVEGEGKGIRRTLRCANAMGDALSEEMKKKVKISRKQKKEFIKNGYIVLKNFMPQELVKGGLHAVDTAYKRGMFHMRGDNNKAGSVGPMPSFMKRFKMTKGIRDMMYSSGLVDVMEQFLGESNVMLVENMGDISFLTTSEKFVEQGVGLKDEIPEVQWRIRHGNGKMRKCGSDHYIHIGVVLSPQQDVEENRGQMLVWPGMNVTSLFTMHALAVRFVCSRSNHCVHFLLRSGSHLKLHPIMSDALGEVSQSELRLYAIVFFFDLC